MQLKKISLFPSLQDEEELEIAEEIIPEPLQWKPHDTALEPEEPEEPEDGALELWDQHELEGQLTIDVYETDSHVVVIAPIAGVKPEDLDITVVNDLLTIRGQRHERVGDRAQYLHRECYWGSFSRSLILPSAVRSDRVKAFLKQGVLTIMLPKATDERVRVHEVEA